MNPEPPVQGANPGAAPALPPVFDPAAAATQLQSLGYAVYPKGVQLTKDQIESDPVLKPVFASIISERISEVGSRIDQDVLESSGIAKQHPNEKYFDYTKRAIAQLKEQIKSAPNVDDVKKSYETQIGQLREANRLGLGENAIRAAVSTLNLNVPAESLEMTRELMINQAMSKPFRLDENNRVVFQKFGGDDGKTLIDVVNPADGKSMEVKDFVGEQFKTLIKAPETPAQGPGKTPAAPNTNSPIPTTVDELGKMLTAQGMRPGPAFNAEVDRLKTQYAITK